MFIYCPACASKGIEFENNNVFRCPACGFVYYHNTAAATGCVISVPENGGGQRLVLLERAKDPGKGKLDLVGGFVDPDEGAIEGLYRELREEIGWTPPVPRGARLADIFTLFASFPNTYPYKNIIYNTCDLYFSLAAPGLCQSSLHLDPLEITAAHFLLPEEINRDDIAFASTRRAIETYLALSAPPARG